MKDVANTMDQVVRDVACSLEAERTQRQESDQFLAGMAHDIARYTEHVMNLVSEVQSLKQSEQQVAASRAEEWTARGQTQAGEVVSLAEHGRNGETHLQAKVDGLYQELRALEERLEERVNDVAGHFQTEQRKAITHAQQRWPVGEFGHQSKGNCDHARIFKSAPREA